jgi:hypothetical protein
MMRLGISVEGSTERLFVSQLLQPHLANFNIHVQAISLNGNVSLDRIRCELPALLGSFDQVSTLYDFYRFKRRGNRTVLELEAAIAELIADNAQRSRLIPYVQLYEFEALLFAVPEITVGHLRGAEKEVKKMQAAVKSCGSPEGVNDSPETSPSHRIAALFPHFDKPLHGPEIIELAGLGAIRAQCPRFDAWISRLENRGNQA